MTNPNPAQIAEWRNSIHPIEAAEHHEWAKFKLQHIYDAGRDMCYATFIFVKEWEDDDAKN